MVRFGPSGNSQSFIDAGVKDTASVAPLVGAMGLSLYEYSFGRGVRMSEEKAAEIGRAFLLHGIEISVHAPYYVNFANPDSEMIGKSIGYITDSAMAVRRMGGSRVVFHPASQGKDIRSVAHRRTLENVQRLMDAMEQASLTDVIVCPETMGKIGNMGTPQEVCEICALHPSIYPCVDFGHINAREQGSLRTEQGYRDLFALLSDSLPKEKLVNMHVHFSQIAYTEKGEKCHLNLGEGEPPYQPLMHLFYEYGISAHVLCESAGRQAEDAALMQAYYQTVCKG
ncbi:MAG: TIM barrel protein [Clostridia bacterium]|nr:TIM barrel protein [Clostridia bacterium]